MLNEDDEEQFASGLSQLQKQDSLVTSNLGKVRVADITFGRNNGRLIRLLKERGEAIIEQDFKKVHHVEDQINERIRNNYERLTTPNHAFIVFEEEEGMKISMRNNDVR